MMPIYFNIESHLWILYLFFVNGLLLHAYFRGVSQGYSRLTTSLEASVLAAFFISLALNGAALLLLDLAGQAFKLMSLILPIFSTLFIGTAIYRRGFLGALAALKVDLDTHRVLLYLIVFLILFYNGGLIEQIADSWWHMSLANKIAITSSFSPEYGHLNGAASRYYPPLWHGNLALATTMSGLPLVELWNSFTAWGAALKVMSFYLLAWSLSRDAAISIFSAVLFVLLPGVGDSYLRVSAWPSHIAYAALFSLFYTMFFYLDEYSRGVADTVKSVGRYVLSQRSIGLVMIVLLLVIAFTHQLEVVWFYAGLLMYTIACNINNIIRRPNKLDDLNNDLFFMAAVLALFVVIASCAYFIVSKWNTFSTDWDRLIAYFLPTIFFILMFLSLLGNRISKQGKFVLAVTVAIVIAMALFLLSIDMRHLLSLISPELAYPNQRYHEIPLIAEGFFGGELKVPGWHLQLRAGLLYSGLISIFLSWGLVFFRPSRLTLFLAGNATLAFLCCISPYVYQWLQYLMNYHSPWRITILVFHPIILATTLVFVWRFLKSNPNKEAGQ